MKKKIIDNRRAKAAQQLQHAGMSKYEIRRRKKLEALNQMEDDSIYFPEETSPVNLNNLTPFNNESPEC